MKATTARQPPPPNRFCPSPPRTESLKGSWDLTESLNGSWDLTESLNGSWALTASLTGSALSISPLPVSCSRIRVRECVHQVAPDRVLRQVQRVVQRPHGLRIESRLDEVRGKDTEAVQHRHSEIAL